MRNETELGAANREYAAAYSVHYTEHDLRSAMQLYKQVIAAHPGCPEADYSRVQIQNIVNSVVPEAELREAQMNLALVRFDQSA